MTKPVGNTLEPIEVDLDALSKLTFPEFIRQIGAILKSYMDSRYAYYEGFRSARSRWANGARKVLAFLGTRGILLTALAATLPLGALNGFVLFGIDKPDVWAFTIALVRDLKAGVQDIALTLQ